MFKHDDKGKPIENCLIDWQIMRYASPVLDLVHFIFTATYKEMRDKHYDDFFKIYHESLSCQLERFGLVPENVFPYTALLEQSKKFGKYGICFHEK